jgi:ankyrin repeat protein
MAGKSTVADFPSLVKKGDYEQCKEWLERVTNRMDRVALVNAASASGSTALFGVCWDGRTDLLELLLDNGAKVNWKNLKENTALSMAIEQDQVECVEILLQNGSASRPVELSAEVEPFSLTSLRLFCGSVSLLSVPTLTSTKCTRFAKPQAKRSALASTR